MLQLDDPRWSELHAGGEDPSYVPQWLHRLLERPNDLVPFEQDCWMLCSQEVTWSTAFAAAPHIVEAARRALPAARLQYVCFLGAVVMYRVPPEESEPSSACPPDLEAAFQRAVAAALEMAVALLPAAGDEPDVRSLLGAIAAFKGYPGFARGIVDLQHDKRPELPGEEIAF